MTTRNAAKPIAPTPVNSICRFYSTKKGCRAGTNCRFRHESAGTEQSSGPTAPKHAAKSKELAFTKPASNDRAQTEQSLVKQNAHDGPETMLPLRSRATPIVPPSRVMQKPTARGNTADPRIFQINQIKRRFSPEETTLSDGTTELAFRLMPTDPDFPFELPDGLKCVLQIPPLYLRAEEGAPARLRLQVQNEEMGLQWRRSVEHGFTSLARNINHTMLNLMNQLDKNLESYLTDEKKPDLISIIPNKPRNALESNSESAASTGNHNPLHSKPAPFDSKKAEEAKHKRCSEVRQLEARLCHQPGFVHLESKGCGYDMYEVPISPQKHADMPPSLSRLDRVKLIVPKKYPLEPCSIELPGTGTDLSDRVSKAFEARVISTPATLIGHINMLVQNLHLLAKETSHTELPKQSPGLDQPEHIQLMTIITQRPEDQHEEDYSHVKVIPRPPEWEMDRSGGDSSSEDSTSDSEYASDDGSGDDHEEDNEEPAKSGGIVETTNPERGIAISFPNIELYGIELLEMALLSITVKCLRCKDALDVTSLTSTTTSKVPHIRSESCRKCASTLTIAYRSSFVHANAIRAGFIDLEGCTVLDMLPSSFLPTCSTCSTTVPKPGVTAVRGASSLAICRECHAKLNFKINEVKFLLISAAQRHDTGALPRKKKKEHLGITVGEALPRQGKCRHYSKSYRWFRFSCCEKVYPCDKCHDEEEKTKGSQHAAERANRMICGFCSREQNFRPEDCGICRMSVIKKTGKGGFWEGGKGTRDKSRMSRKDPRKYKRRPGGTLKKT